MHADLESAICVAVVYRSLRITQDRVAESFDVSRAIARDALARLHSSGVVDKDRQGRSIAERITPQRIRSLSELRWLIQTEALAQAARATPVEVVHRHARDKPDEALRNVPTLASQAHIDLEGDLHVRLLRSSGCSTWPSARTNSRFIFDAFGEKRRFTRCCSLETGGEVA
ncbi:GntR family transcriptional regulator [Caballeronia grimmiae]|uniref:hypothetical protein n=1 Tax=Caballeronia grimmiae TaxID=1071679 RepID=UPI0038BC5C19